MSDYDYIVGSLFGLAVFMVILGNLGGADDIYGDDFVVIDSGELNESEVPSSYDFDVDKIRFTPDVQQVRTYTSDGLVQEEIISSSAIKINESGRIYWNGSQNDLNESYGYVKFNTTERTDVIFLQFFNSAYLFGNNVGFFITDENNNTVELTGGSPRGIDLSGVGGFEDNQNVGVYDGLNNIEVLEIRLDDTESWVDIDGYKGQDEDLLEVIVAFLVNSLKSIAELGKMVVGYLSFTAAVPGLLGTFLRLYMGIFLLVFIVKEFWIG